MTQWTPEQGRKAAAEEKRKAKRHGFFFKYPKNVRRGLWRLIAQRTGVHVTIVRCIVEELEIAAHEARKDGWIGFFSPGECAANLDMTVATVEAVLRELYDEKWLMQEHIAEWAIEQASADTGATLRQQHRRARKAAAEAIKGGYATPGQIELMSAQERHDIERLDALLHFGERPPTPPREVAPEYFEPAADAAENDRLARLWLLGNGQVGVYGVANRVIVENLGMNRLGANYVINRWLNDDLGGDAVVLASIISGAHREALTGEHFHNVVDRAIKERVRELEKGPAFNFPPMPIKGGRRG